MYSGPFLYMLCHHFLSQGMGHFRNFGDIEISSADDTGVSIHKFIKSTTETRSSLINILILRITFYILQINFVLNVRNFLNDNSVSLAKWSLSEQTTVLNVFLSFNTSWSCFFLSLKLTNIGSVLILSSGYSQLWSFMFSPCLCRLPCEFRFWIICPMLITLLILNWFWQHFYFSLLTPLRAWTVHIATI